MNEIDSRPVHADVGERAAGNPVSTRRFSVNLVVRQRGTPNVFL